MILLIECIVGCLVFGTAVVGSVLINKTLWLHEFAPAVQEEFLRLHPEYQKTKQRTGGIDLVTVKIIVCLVFVVILSCMAYIAGARDFASAFCKCYIVWSAVNWFDVFVLDLGILAHWKKVRLPGTEHMDKEYRSNNRKGIIRFACARVSNFTRSAPCRFQAGRQPILYAGAGPDLSVLRIHPVQAAAERKVPNSTGKLTGPP